MPQRYSPTPLSTEINLSGTEGVQVFVTPSDSGGRRRFDSGKLAEALKVFAQEGLDKKAEKDNRAVASGEQAFVEAQVAIGAGEDPEAVLDRLTKKLEIDPVSTAPFQRGVAKAKAGYGASLLTGTVDSILLDLRYTDEEGEAALSEEEVRRKFNLAFQDALKNTPYLAALQDDPFVGQWVSGKLVQQKAAGEVAAEQNRRSKEILFAQQQLHRSFTSTFNAFDGPISSEEQKAVATQLEGILASAKRDNIPGADQTFMEAALSYARTLSKGGENITEARHFIAAIMDTKIGGTLVRERSEANEALVLFEQSLAEQAAASDERKNRKEQALLSRAATRANNLLSDPEIQTQIEGGADPDQFIGQYIERLQADGIYDAALDGSLRSEFRKEARALQGLSLQEDQLTLDARQTRRRLGEDFDAQETFDALLDSPFTTPEMVRAIDPGLLSREQRRIRNSYLAQAESREAFLQKHERGVLGPLDVIQKSVLESLSNLDPSIQSDAEVAVIGLLNDEQKALQNFANSVIGQGLSAEDEAAAVREYRDTVSTRFQAQVQGIAQSYRGGIQTDINAVRDLYRSGDTRAASRQLAELQRDGKIPETLADNVLREIQTRHSAQEFVRQGLLLDKDGSEVRLAIDDAVTDIAAALGDEEFDSKTLDKAVREIIEEDQKREGFTSRFIGDFGVDFDAFETYLKETVQKAAGQSVGGVVEQALKYKADYSSFSQKLTASTDPSRTYYEGVSVAPGASAIVREVFDDEGKGLLTDRRASRAVALAERFDDISAEAQGDDLFYIYAPFFLSPDEVLGGSLVVKTSRLNRTGLTQPGIGKTLRSESIPIPSDVDWLTVPVFASERSALDWARTAGDERSAELMSTLGFKDIDQLVNAYKNAGLFRVRADGLQSVGSTVVR